MTNFQALIAKFGGVQHNGQCLALTQQAYCSNHPDSQTYQAKAEDAKGNEFMVYWDCLDGWMDAEDESDCCDWSKYTVQEL